MTERESMNGEELVDVKVKIAQLDTSMKQAFHMINEQKEEMKAIHTLAGSVEKLAFEMSQMRKEQGEIKDKVEEIEKKPLKTYDAVKLQIVISIVTAIVGFFIGKFI